MPAPSESPPTRGAWVEIPRCLPPLPRLLSRPPHGGRGLKSNERTTFVMNRNGRPPHGGRGLKLPRTPPGVLQLMVAPHTGAWVEMAMQTGGIAGSRSRPPHGRRRLKIFRPETLMGSSVPPNHVSNSLYKQRTNTPSLYRPNDTPAPPAWVAYLSSDTAGRTGTGAAGFSDPPMPANGPSF